MKILVTGGSGFIGSHTCLELILKGYKVLIIDSLINSSKKVVDRISQLAHLNQNEKDRILEFIQCDLRDENFLRNIFKNYNVDAVIHFAGLKSIYESTINPLKYWDFNVKSTLNLLNVMNEFDCKNIVFSSSASVYGNSQSKKKFNEESIPNPLNPYGETKFIIENLLEKLHSSSPNEWRIAILRYFNPIGAHPSGLLGEFPTNQSNNIIPAINKVAAGEKLFLEICGSDWDTPDGTGIRDYIHVMDLASGHIKSLEYIFKSDSNFIKLNLGTGEGTSVLSLLETFEKVNNIKIPFKYVPKRVGDTAYSIADNKQALNKLGWLPKKDLNDMCKDSWNFFSRNPSGY
tara:strand:+ start:3018 stop:4055 length:1038 start_codon:yes stop_codon:yes gene_type:complete